MRVTVAKMAKRQAARLSFDVIRPALLAWQQAIAPIVADSKFGGLLDGCQLSRDCSPRKAAAGCTITYEGMASR
jgi:hypothetical protein